MWIYLYIYSCSTEDFDFKKKKTQIFSCMLSRTKIYHGMSFLGQTGPDWLQFSHL